MKISNIKYFLIIGSSPKKCGSLINKVDFINKLDDIEKSHPRQLHYKLNKEQYNLSNKDIRGTIPQCVKFKTERKSFNPLEPNYILPKSENFNNISQLDSRFLRDSMNHDDIEGSRPKKIFKFKDNSDFVNKGIIEKSSPNKLIRNRIVNKKSIEDKLNISNNSIFYDNLNYSDVTNFKYKSQRITNPLEPEYRYNCSEKFILDSSIKIKQNKEINNKKEIENGDIDNKNNSIIENIGKIEGSKPQSLYPFIHKDPKNLKVSDILGAQSGTRNKINRFNSMNFNLMLSDLKKSHAGSLKKCIVTKRQTNPLVPEYINPGDSEIFNNDNNPFGEGCKKNKKNWKNFNISMGDHNLNNENNKDNLVNWKKSFDLNSENKSSVSDKFSNNVNNPINEKVE